MVLVEEPQAAFYAWIHAHRGDWESRVRPGQKILVCDVGGGTTDLTLIRVRPAEGSKVLFHRIAVGEHLILGGDNLDLALAHHIEDRLTHGGKLEPRQWGPLIRSCRQAKETLLGPDAPDRLVVNVLGGGSRLIGAAIQVELTRREVEDLLVEGFLPRVNLDDKPAARRSGFQEFGLPYAPDAAITRYLAAFLTAHRHAVGGVADAATGPLVGGVADAATGSTTPLTDPARPDLVLFNGGFFESPVLRQRLLDVLGSWFGASAAPQVLANDRLDLAVARGAAYYGMVRRGHGVRISGGLAHSYYIGVETTRPEEPAALCLLPAGVEEGHAVDLTERRFDLLIRQPVEFPLYVSSTRTTDRPGALLVVDGEQMTPLPPIRTVLQSGRKIAAETIGVNLHAKLTAIGTLELWCTEVKGDRQWRLEFDVRAATRTDVREHRGTGEAEGVVDEQVVSNCRELIRAAFRQPVTPATRTEGLVKRLEQASAIGRYEWPSSLMRGFWETLIEMEPGRRLDVEHEARWLNLAGFCLRPGYGLAVDDWRVSQAWRLFFAKVAHPKNELCRAEWWILWRRIAGGLSAGQQQTLAEPLLAAWRTYLRKAGAGLKGRSGAFQFGPHESAEAWRLLGSLELLKPAMKIELGDILLELLPRDRMASMREAGLFCLGRLGARVPVYGPLNDLVPIETVEQWIGRLMDLPSNDEKIAFALVQLARRTGDRYRDISDTLRESVLRWLADHEAPPHFADLVAHGGQLRDEEQRFVFGEALPRGLRIE